MHNNLVIKLEETKLQVVDQNMFLGVISNKKLTLILHVKYLKAKSTRAQQPLQVVANT